MPTKWLQERADGSKNGHGMPPRRAFSYGRAFCGSQGCLLMVKKGFGRMRVRWLLACTLTASLAAGGGVLDAAPVSLSWGSGLGGRRVCFGEAGTFGAHALQGEWGSMRLRGGAQVERSQMPRSQSTYDPI